LFVKVPSQKLTLVVLTNTDKLSQPFPLGDGDVFTSPIAQLFYRHYISKLKSFKAIDYGGSIAAIRNTLAREHGGDYKEFYNKELISQASINNIKGDTAKARGLYQLYGELNFRGKQALGNSAPLAAIKEMGVNGERKVQFTLGKTMRVRIYGVGENCSADFSSWCDYGWVEDNSGERVWQMQGQAAKHAGGAIKNQLVDTSIILPRGTYTLRYKSDGGHAHNHWDSDPPEHFFWGILVTSETNN
jgi:hypothetical protein